MYKKFFSKQFLAEKIKTYFCSIDSYEFISTLLASCSFDVLGSFSI